MCVCIYIYIYIPMPSAWVNPFEVVFRVRSISKLYFLFHTY